MSGHEAESVVTIYLSNDRGELLQCWYCCGVEDTLSNTSDVGGEAVYAMRIHAAEVGEDETGGYETGVRSWHGVGYEEVFSEVDGCGTCDMEGSGLGV